jgi:hypothetical protein
MSSIESNQESKTLLTDEEVLHLKKEETPYDFANPEYIFVPKGLHQWKQEGTYVVCRSCDIEHAIFIGMDKIMIGISEDGSPKLVDRQEYFKKGYKAFK